MASLDPGVEGRAASQTMVSLGCGFINNPVTNSDVSAVLGVRSRSVFALTEPTAPPEKSRHWCQDPPAGWTDGLATTLDAELLSD